MKILIIGIGNVLYADEGVRVHFVNYLSENYQFDYQDQAVTFMDGGTLAQGLTPILAKYDHMVIVDTVNAAGVTPGEVYFFNFDSAPPEIDWQGSAHEVEMLQTLTMMELFGDRPETYVLGVTPTIMEPMHIGLTEKLLAAIPLMEKTLLKHMESLGCQVTRIADVSLESLIPDSYKRGHLQYTQQDR